MATISLQSSDGVNFSVSVEVARKSNTLKTMLDNLGVEEGKEESIPLTKIRGDILGRVVDYCIKHKDDPDPTEEVGSKDYCTDNISQWDREFLKVDQPTLFEVILAANFLDIKGLLDLTCKTVANMIKGKTTKEIREHFGIKNDFTAEEEERIRIENEWCEEGK